MANLPETPQWEEGIYQIETSDPVLGGPGGITNRPAKQLASRTLYLKQQVEKGNNDLKAHTGAADPHTQYAPKESPVLTGEPTTPTPPLNDNSKKMANTEFVARAVAALAASAPEALDTLKELADSLGNDPNFAATVLNQLAGKLDKSRNLADLTDVPEALKNLRLGAGAPPIGIPFFWPSPAMPNTVMDEWADMVFLKPNGASFSATEYPKLAKVWTGLVIPDMRGEFLRIWDDGRGVDMGRALLSGQVATSFSQFSGNYNEGSGHTIFNPDSSAGYQAGFARFKYTSPAVGDGVNFITVRPRNIAFNFLVRAK